MAAAGAQGRHCSLVIAPRVAERVRREFRVMQPGLGDVSHLYLTLDCFASLAMTGDVIARSEAAKQSPRAGHGSALRKGARVTTASMSAIALTMNRAVIG